MLRGVRSLHRVCHDLVPLATGGVRNETPQATGQEGLEVIHGTRYTCP